MTKLEDINFGQLVLGRCTVCAMRGILRGKMIMQVMDAINGASREDVRAVCVTCYDAPAGVKSDNMGHNRLEDDKR